MLDKLNGIDWMSYLNLILTLGGCGLVVQVVNSVIFYLFLFLLLLYVPLFYLFFTKFSPRVQNWKNENK